MFYVLCAHIGTVVFPSPQLQTCYCGETPFALRTLFARDGAYEGYIRAHVYTRGRFETLPPTPSSPGAGRRYCGCTRGAKS
jgi:hypothetical protein